jgi:probable HAF family extracellular repeat protein
LAIAIILAAVSGNAVGASFVPLGQLPGAEVLGENLVFRSSAQAVSADGGVVVGFAATGDGAELPFRWTAASGMVALEPFPEGTVFSIAHGVSADGSVVVGRSASGSAFQAFRWTTAGGSAGLGSLPSNRTPFSEAYAVSSDGNVVVGRSSSGNGGEAFRWTPDGGLEGLGVLPGIIADSSAFGVSADGSVVVGESFGSAGTEAVRWTAAGGIVGLGRLPGDFSSSALGVSADGNVIVGVSSGLSGRQAFRWTASGGMVGLGDLPGGRLDSGASGVSGDGSVVVGSGSFAVIGESGEPEVRSPEAFVWTEAAGMQRLFDVLVTNGATGLEGWTLSAATAISLDGKWVVGIGRNPLGYDEAFLADISPVPLPTPAWLLAAAVLSLGARLRSRHQQKG